MTPAQQTKVRIAIAEWMGWKRFSDPQTHDVGWIHPGGHRLMHLPDVCNDLNALREARSGLSDEQQKLLVRHLVGSDACFDRMHKMDPERFNDREPFCEDHIHRIGWDEIWSFILQATPEEHAEALYRTIKGEAP